MSYLYLFIAMSFYISPSALASADKIDIYLKKHDTGDPIESAELFDQQTMASGFPLNIKEYCLLRGRLYLKYNMYEEAIKEYGSLINLESELEDWFEILEVLTKLGGKQLIDDNLFPEIFNHLYVYKDQNSQIVKQIVKIPHYINLKVSKMLFFYGSTKQINLFCSQFKDKDYPICMK